MHVEYYKLGTMSLAKVPNTYGYNNNSRKLTAEVLYKGKKNRLWRRVGVVEYYINFKTQGSMLGNCGLMGLQGVNTEFNNFANAATFMPRNNMPKLRAEILEGAGSHSRDSLPFIHRHEMVDLFFEKFMIDHIQAFMITNRNNRQAKQLSTIHANHRKRGENPNWAKSCALGVTTATIIEALQSKDYGGAVTISHGWNNPSHIHAGDLSIVQVVIWTPPKAIVFKRLGKIFGEKFKKDSIKELYKRSGMKGDKKAGLRYLDEELVQVAGAEKRLN